MKPTEGWCAVRAKRGEFGVRQHIPVQVRWPDGEPVEFQRRPARRAARYLIMDAHQCWIEESPWPFPSPMPVGGDRLRCWRVTARSTYEPDLPAQEFVLRMRAGPGMWDLTPLTEPARTG